MVQIIGGHYEPHVDYFGEARDLERGDRVATMLFYLTSDHLRGGATVFPFLNLAVNPIRNAALFWYNTKRNGRGGEAATLHAGCPVLYGTKLIANLWIRERAQVYRRPCSKL